MHRSQPNRLHDELDALLDGRPVELTDELAPLAEAADALRAELAAHQLDPEVANRHLEQVLKGSATVVRMPARPQPNGWDVRRRVAAVVLAAALVLAPATMASAAALPGQAMYPFKLAIEQLRLASVQWSPSREAGERTRIADERLDEVQSLLNLRIYNQLPGAIKALSRMKVSTASTQLLQMLRDPLRGLEAVRSVCRGHLHFQFHAVRSDDPEERRAFVVGRPERSAHLGDTSGDRRPQDKRVSSGDSSPACERFVALRQSSLRSGQTRLGDPHLSLGFLNPSSGNCPIGEESFGAREIKTRGIK